MTVLVTGAFGYLGSALMGRLARDGHAIVAFGHPAARPIRFSPDVHVIEGDALGDLLGLAVTEHAPHAVVHLVGGGGPAACARDPIATVRRHVVSTARVRAILPVGTIRILASSIYVYPPCDRACGEGEPTGPETFYGAAKEAAEAAWLVGAADDRVCALRFSHIYGPGPILHDDIATRVAHAAATGSAARIDGGGRRRIDFVHIADACDAIACALRSLRLPRVVNVGGGEPITIADVARLVDAPTMRGEGDAADAPDRTADISVARKALGWQPQVPLARGMREFVETLRGAAWVP